MIYQNKNGLNVAHEGTVVIENVQHYVINGFVSCSATLNHMSWNTTEMKSVCPKCAKLISKNPIQLKLEL